MTDSQPSYGSPAELWTRTVDRVKDRVNNRSLWETMEKAVGITVDDGAGLFIIGLDSRLFNNAGYLTTAEHRNAIETAASAIAGRPLRIRVIEGTTLTDWLATQKADARVAAMHAATYEKRDRIESETQNWDALYDFVARSYSGLPMRQLPQVKSRYLTDMLYALSEGMDRLYGEKPEETTDRLLARVIDRVAQNAEVPSTLVALELDRLRAWQRQNSD